MTKRTGERLRVGVVGVTGAVGKQILKVLEERSFPTAELVPMASQRSAGTLVSWQERRLEILAAEAVDFSTLDLVFVAAGTSVSKQIVPTIVEQGPLVIDKSNAFRMNPEVPLVVPEVNPQAVAAHQGIIASPNCSTIQMVVALEPLRRASGLKRVLVSTYQSVSGAGQQAIDELHDQTEAVLHGTSLDTEVFDRQMAFNLLPQIDRWEDSGYTLEEMKLVRETRKIMAEPELAISATAVRAPVFVSHAESVLIETEEPLSPAEARDLLSAAPGVQVIDDPGENAYPTPIDAAGTDDILVGRIRRDLSNDNALWLWVVGDNLRKGAATNAVQIAEIWREYEGYENSAG